MEVSPNRPVCPGHLPSGIYPHHIMTSEDYRNGSGKHICRCWKMFCMGSARAGTCPAIFNWLLIKLMENGKRLCLGTADPEVSWIECLLVQEELTWVFSFVRKGPGIVLEDGKPLMSLPLPCLPRSMFLPLVLTCLPFITKKPVAITSPFSIRPWLTPTTCVQKGKAQKW